MSNDLEHDQRVAKVCATLLSLGYSISLVGRMLPHSKNVERPYEIKRFRLLFKRGALFYASLNIRLFFYLLFKKTDAILANDLDTLLPAYIISKWRRKKLYYDSHEYFTEAEGLTGRNFQKKIWLLIERWIFPKLKNVYTVNESIATIYRNLYNTEVKVVRNIPMLQERPLIHTRSELDLPTDKKIILLQGAYIDPDRGGMELVQAMKHLEDVLLLVIGAGRDMDNMKQAAIRLQVEGKIRFMPRLSAERLFHYTSNADLGLSLDKPIHLNYTLSLPNKLFDYIHACTPVLASDLPELRKIIMHYRVGMLCSELTPQGIAHAVSEALHHPQYMEWKANCRKAMAELNWQQEEKVLHQIYA